MRPGWVRTAKNGEIRPINRYISEIIEDTHREDTHSYNGRLVAKRI